MAQSIRISFTFTSTAGVVRLIVGVVTAPLLIRFLGVESFGIWAVASSRYN